MSWISKPQSQKPNELFPCGPKWQGKICQKCKIGSQFSSKDWEGLIQDRYKHIAFFFFIQIVYELRYKQLSAYFLKKLGN